MADLAALTQAMEAGNRAAAAETTQAALDEGATRAWSSPP